MIIKKIKYLKMKKIIQNSSSLGQFSNKNGGS
jgi:hypothetical protein